MKKAKIIINLDNLIYNFEKIRKITNYSDNVIPVLKANAYNMGIYNVVNTLLKLDIPQKKYFVFALKEGIELRKLFPELEKIFILNGIFKGDGKIFKKYALTPVINSLEQLQLAKKAEINEIILQFNTGMNRSGIEINELDKIIEFINKNKMKVLMIMTHFCCANNKEDLINYKQIENFKKIIQFFPEKEILKGISGSDGILNFNLDNLCNTCRPGLILYGYYEGFKPVCSIYSYINTDGENLFLPLGISNGFTSEYGNGNSYILYNGVKIFINSITKNKIILDTKDKNLIGKEVVILGSSITYQEFEKMANTNINEIIARIISNCDKEETNFQINLNRNRDLNDNSIPKAYYTIQNNNYKEFFSTILEKRDILENGSVGYRATENTKKGDKLATFFGGYLDGISSSMNNKKCNVFVEDKNKKLVECFIFGKISMDQTIIKIPEKDFNNINIGAKVIIFDNDHNIDRFETITGKSKDELFFYLNKSSRINYNNF